MFVINEKSKKIYEIEDYMLMHSSDFNSFLGEIDKEIDIEELSNFKQLNQEEKINFLEDRLKDKSELKEAILRGFYDDFNCPDIFKKHIKSLSKFLTQHQISNKSAEEVGVKFQNREDPILERSQFIDISSLMLSKDYYSNGFLITKKDGVIVDIDKEHYLNTINNLFSTEEEKYNVIRNRMKNFKINDKEYTYSAKIDIRQNPLLPLFKNTISRMNKIRRLNGKLNNLNDFLNKKNKNGFYDLSENIDNSLSSIANNIENACLYLQSGDIKTTLKTIEFIKKQEKNILKIEKNNELIYKIADTFYLVDAIGGTPSLKTLNDIKNLHIENEGFEDFIEKEIMSANVFHLNSRDNKFFLRNRMREIKDSDQPKEVLIDQELLELNTLDSRYDFLVDFSKTIDKNKPIYEDEFGEDNIKFLEVFNKLHIAIKNEETGKTKILHTFADDRVLKTLKELSILEVKKTRPKISQKEKREKSKKFNI